MATPLDPALLLMMDSTDDGKCLIFISLFSFATLHLSEYSCLVLVEAKRTSMQEKQSKKRPSCVEEGTFHQLFPFFD
jgi:hypothetical protein